MQPGAGRRGPPLAAARARAGPGRWISKARRTGSTVTLTFTVPSVNLDDTRPADIGKVEVYAYTAMAQNDVRDVRRMKLVTSLPVRKPPDPDAEHARAGKPGERAGRGARHAGWPARPAGPGLEQGARRDRDRDARREHAHAPGAGSQKREGGAPRRRSRARVRHAGRSRRWPDRRRCRGGPPLLRGLRRQPARQPWRRVAAAAGAARRGARCAGEAGPGRHRGRRRGELVRARRAQGCRSRSPRTGDALPANVPRRTGVRLPSSSSTSYRSRCRPSVTAAAARTGAGLAAPARPDGDAGQGPHVDRHAAPSSGSSAATTCARSSSRARRRSRAIRRPSRA